MFIFRKWDDGMKRLFLPVGGINSGHTYSHKEMVLELTNRKLRVRSDSNSSL